MKEIERKFLKVRKQMEKYGVDCLILPPSGDLLYVTGYRGYMAERPSFMMLFHDAAYYISPIFEAPYVKSMLGQYVEVIGWDDVENPYEILAKKFGEDKCKAAIDYYAPVFLYYNLKKQLTKWEWVSDRNIMEEVRLCKDEEEIALIAAAQDKSADAFMKLTNYGLCGRTESEVAEYLKQMQIEEGLEPWTSIVAAGPNGASPHHMTDDTVIKEGDTVVIDFGGVYKGYYSDTTRTLIVKHASDRVKEVYEIVKQANKNACMCVKEGVTCDYVDGVARKVITDAGYGPYFTHRLGHGIGMDIHEPPYIVGNNNYRLENGNVFSDEPGIYLLDEFGVRIEDLIAVREGKGQMLGKLSHEMLIVD